MSLPNWRLIWAHGFHPFRRDREYAQQCPHQHPHEPTCPLSWASHLFLFPPRSCVYRDLQPGEPEHAGSRCDPCQPPITIWLGKTVLRNACHGLCPPVWHAGQDSHDSRTVMARKGWAGWTGESPAAICARWPTAGWRHDRSLGDGTGHPLLYLRGRQWWRHVERLTC